MSEAYSQKYTVVCFFDPLGASSDFSAAEWPLHVTILDTFKTAWQLSTLCEELQKVAGGIAPFDAVPVREAMLGEDKDVPVKLLRIDEAMSTLHYKLMDLVDQGGLVFNTPEFVGSGFLPHATDQTTEQVEIGKPYRLVSISLVDMFPNGDYMQRKVVGTFDFNG